MPIVTSLKPQKSGKRVNVYLDGRYGFGIDLETLMTLKIAEGTEYSESEIKEIVKKAEFQKTLEKLLKYATLRPRSIFEIKQWLKRKRVHESLHKDLFNRLKRLDLVDDEKFARWWVEQRMAFKPRSARLLTYELQVKGIRKEVIEKVLDKMDIDELKIARKLAVKMKNKDKKKVVAYLSRQGFDWETIKRVVDYKE